MSNFATCSPPYTPRELHAHTCPLIVLSKPRHEVNVHSDERWVRALTYPGFGLRNRVGFLEKTPGRVTVLKERTVVPSRDMISYKTTRPRPPSLKSGPVHWVETGSQNGVDLCRQGLRLSVGRQAAEQLKRQASKSRPHRRTYHPPECITSAEMPKLRVLRIDAFTP
jgi:hypothetical protein